jgi:signal transduction histidine kinase
MSSVETNLARPNLKIFRTTAFRLMAIYLLIFAMFVIGVLGYIGYHTNIILGAQLREQLTEEVRGLAADYRRGGLPRLIRVIERRSRQPGANIYLLTDQQGNAIAGNVDSLPKEILQKEGLVRFTYERRLPSPPPGFEDHHPFDAEGPSQAIARVFTSPTGSLLVGRDLREREAFGQIYKRAFFLSVLLMIVLAILGWMMISRRVLKRIDAFSQTSQRIMAGDLSERIAIAGTNDEFDRLAQTQNTMLARIEELLAGVKEVSDNIAHDLKTPLTRIRNRLEAALRSDPSDNNDRAAIEAAIEESDQLIKTFNALLLIARVEAGSKGQSLEPLDISIIAGDVVELYEAVAEEAGAKLKLESRDQAMACVNRELIAQALANLIDNAIKHTAGTPDTQIHVHVEKYNDIVRLSVRDNGPGIADADRERALQRFVRLEKSRSAPGSGLGLALVQAIARFHSAELRLDNAGPGLSAMLILKTRAGQS